ncbi:MAG: hypothetical protein HWN66_11465 [Candidatus Helarchaeota archaeon]|nr:hypothetical protein [Candidatus Helarchaeota archaeon]
MPKKFKWDLIRATAVMGGIVGIILSILMLLHIWGPIGGFIAPEWVSATFEIIICCVILFGYGVLGWDVWKRHTFIIYIASGIVLIVLFGNLAGILLVVAGIPIPFGS